MIGKKEKIIHVSISEDGLTFANYLNTLCAWFDASDFSTECNLITTWLRPAPGYNG